MMSARARLLALGVMFSATLFLSLVDASAQSVNLHAPDSNTVVNRYKQKGKTWQKGGVPTANFNTGDYLDQIPNDNPNGTVGHFLEFLRKPENKSFVTGLTRAESSGLGSLAARNDCPSERDFQEPATYTNPCTGKQHKHWFVGAFQFDWQIHGKNIKNFRNYDQFAAGDLKAQLDTWINYYVKSAIELSGCDALFAKVRAQEPITITQVGKGCEKSPFQVGVKHIPDLADLKVCLQFQSKLGHRMVAGRNDKVGPNPCAFDYGASIRRLANQKSRTPSGPVNAGPAGIQCMKGQQLPLPPVEEAHIPAGEDPNAPPAEKDDPSYSQKCESLVNETLQARGVTKLPNMPVAAMSSDPKYLIVGRYGKFRPAGFPKPTSKAHYHNGLDFRARQGTPLYAADSGKVVVSWWGPSLGNQVAILRDGTNDVIHYGHMSRLDVKYKQHVKAGDQIGLSGNTGSSEAPHLHFQYFVPPDDAERFNTDRFDKNTGGRVGRKAGYPMEFEKNKLVTTDPSPYLPIPIKMKDGDWKGLGDNTWHQYCVLRELTGKAGSYSDYSAMLDRIDSQVDCNTGSTGNGGDWTVLLPDVGGWGDPEDVLGMSPDGVEDHRSFLERALEAAAYRFGSEHWARKILHMTDRKLWMDYMLARRTQTWLEYQLTRKRDQINMNLAVLLANAADDSTAQAQTAAARSPQRAKVD